MYSPSLVYPNGFALGDHVELTGVINHPYFGRSRDPIDFNDWVNQSHGRESVLQYLCCYGGAHDLSTRYLGGRCSELLPPTYYRVSIYFDRQEDLLTIWGGGSWVDARTSRRRRGCVWVP